jgi:APA family basic amino acid/polyamine antiporter
MCVALVVGNMIGSGVFMLPASLAPYGLDSLTGWLFTAAGAVALAVVFAALARAVPGSGGPYVYTRVAFGELGAFVVAWGYWVAVWVGNAAIATGGVSYLSALFPSLFRLPGAAAASTLVAVWVLTLVNCRGVRTAGWVQAVTTVIKLVPLLAVALLGLFFVRRDLLLEYASAPITLSGTTAAATLTLWAMLGLESATVPAEKVEDAERTVPRATLLGTILTAVVCALACTVVLLIVPRSQLAISTAPFADAARTFWGEGSALLVAAFGAISTFGALNGWILVQGEVPCAMARDGVFPRPFARQSRRGTPTFALVTSSALVSLLVVMNYRRGLVDVFTFMILLATSANLVAYLLCALALLHLQHQGRLGAARRGTPALATAGVLGAAYSLWAIFGAGQSAILWGLLLLVAGLPVFALMRRAERRRDEPH